MNNIVSSYYSTSFFPNSKKIMKKQKLFHLQSRSGILFPNKYLFLLTTLYNIKMVQVPESIGHSEFLTSGTHNLNKTFKL